MSKSYVFQGKNVDQAIQNASDELRVPPGKIKHEVLAYGSSGIFGLVGVKKAKIRVTLPEEDAQIIEKKRKEKRRRLSRKTVKCPQTGSKKQPPQSNRLNPWGCRNTMKNCFLPEYKHYKKSSMESPWEQQST